MNAQRLALALGALAGAALVHCSPTDVVVADLPPHHDGGDPDHRCLNDDDCHGDGFCARTACDDITGQCAARPVFCDPARSPTCGCDGVTYWNDCLRQLNGVTASTDGQCGVGAATCGGAIGPCPVTGASCARSYPSQTRCAKEEPGICWVLPQTCPTGDTELYVLCYSATCGDACTVIRSEQPFRPLGGATCQ